MTALDDADFAKIFDALRPRLFSIAYQVLGNRTAADQLMQEARSQWNAVAHRFEQATEAGLIAMTARLAIDRLRSSALNGRAYTGWRLREKLVEIVDTEEAAPDSAAAFAGGVELAFLSALRRVTPEEQAAFIMRQVFDQDYAEVASVLDRPEAACRQMVLRSQQQLRQERPSLRGPHDDRCTLLEKFMQAVIAVDHAAISALIAEQVEIFSEDAPKTPVPAPPLRGIDRIAKLYGTADLHLTHYSYQLCRINGEPGLLRYLDGKFESAQSFLIDEGRIIAIFLMHDSDKLVGVPLLA